MSSKGAEVIRVTAIEPIPNADLIEVALIGGYKSIVGKGQFQSGDLCGYMPEGYLVPQELLASIGLEGKLAGASKNRIKPMKMRGVLSEGICLLAQPSWTEGQDITEELGLTKWHAEVPRQLWGSAYELLPHERLSFDIENIKREPTLLQIGEEVSITEKIHGTFLLVVGLPERLRRDDAFHWHGRVIVTSKGLAGRSIGIKHNEENAENVYMRAADKFGLREKALELADTHDEVVFLLGEVYGTGIQDLHYGTDLGYGCFDIKIGDEWLGFRFYREICIEDGIPRVPSLYIGPWQPHLLPYFTNGSETVSQLPAVGKGTGLPPSQHIREGVVVKPTNNRRDRFGNRVILKSVSEAYLTRKNGTEFN